MAEIKKSAGKELSLRTVKILCITAGWLLILAACALNVGIKIQRYEIFTDKVTAPVRILLLTDYHGSDYGAGQRVLLDAAAAQKPDAVLLGGDMFEDSRDYRNSLELLESLGKTYPCFYVTGNHEKWNGDIDFIKETVRSYGIEVLDGGGNIFSAGGQDILICGVDYGFENYSAPFENCKSDDGLFTVLMSHRPDLVNEYIGNGFDLVVCGHAHGGQVIIPFVLNGLYAPDQGVFPEYAGGRYTLADGATEMIVSRGLCKNIVPRVFNPPEVVVIDIQPLV